MEGFIFIPQGGKFAIFEPAIDVGHSIPVYATFEFTQAPEWIQVSKEKVNQIKMLVSNITLTDEQVSPRLSATIKNDSLFIVPEVDVVAILYDASGNALAASRTYLDVLNGEESRDLNFTWPEPISGVVTLKEIIPMYNIFSAKLK